MAAVHEDGSSGQGVVVAEAPGEPLDDLAVAVALDPGRAAGVVVAPAHLPAVAVAVGVDLRQTAAVVVDPGGRELLARRLPVDEGVALLGPPDQAVAVPGLGQVDVLDAPSLVGELDQVAGRVPPEAVDRLKRRELRAARAAGGLTVARLDPGAVHEVDLQQVGVAADGQPHHERVVDPRVRQPLGARGTGRDHLGEPAGALEGLRRDRRQVQARAVARRLGRAPREGLDGGGGDVGRVGGVGRVGRVGGVRSGLAVARVAFAGVEAAADRQGRERADQQGGAHRSSAGAACRLPLNRARRVPELC